MYSIPRDGDVILAIRNVLARYKTVRTQAEMKDKVEQELNFGGGDYRVGGRRLRRLAIVSGVADVRVHTRVTGGRSQTETCPVCGTGLKASRNMTIYGKTVTTGFKCPKCGYRTEEDCRRVPSRYEFTLRRRR